MSEAVDIKRDFTTVNQIIQRHDRSQGSLISILQEVQNEYHYLPEDVLLYVADALSIPSATIYGVATFYESFSLEPKGKYLIRVCDGTACHVRGSEKLMSAVRNILKLSEDKHTTDDMLFTLDVVSCLGACGLAPAMVINDTVYPKVAPSQVREIIDEILKQEGLS